MVFFKIHFNIILPSPPRASKWFLSLRFPNQNPVCTTPVPHICYTPQPFHYSLFDHSNILVRNTDHAAHHYVSSSSPLWAPSLICPNTFLQRPQPTLLPHRVTPSFTLTTNRYKYSHPNVRNAKYVVTSVGQGSVFRREGIVTNPLRSNIANNYTGERGGEAGYRHELGAPVG